MREWTCNPSDVAGFPSPCGVLVLKCASASPTSAERTEFPSPCGVLVLKSPDLIVHPSFNHSFPSPCGVLVLKYKVSLEMHGFSVVSVPLRGSGS